VTDASSEALHFREAMSRIAASVHVVTTDGPAGRHGATATSVASLTDEPPTLIVCLNVGSRAYRLASRNGVLAVNALGRGHEALARAFARSSRGVPDDRFGRGVWGALSTGAPVLEDAVAIFDGRIVRETVVGTHAALFVEIESIRWAEPPSEALLYHHRAYHPLQGG
jgi:flavin reductase (DIM6/NTAB) family NADH-FMN oxidoreductase RutF